MDPPVPEIDKMTEPPVEDFNNADHGGMSPNADSASGSIPSETENEIVNSSTVDTPRSSSCPPGPITSTPMSQALRSHSASEGGLNVRSASFTQTDLSISDFDELKVPIVGFEVMEQRAKFTVFKLYVKRSPRDNWFVFRRYTDFVRLNDQLKLKFPSFRLALPPKKWFGNNFDKEFLEDRLLGLQAFVSNITGHKDIVKSNEVREFFCLDEPPGPHDSLEESRALCESLEETIYNMKTEMKEKDKLIQSLKEENASLQAENMHLLRSLSGDNGASSCRRSSPRTESDGSLTESEYPSAVEADQQQNNGDSEKLRVFRSLSRELEEDLSLNVKGMVVAFGSLKE
ncbi:sorting nexin-16-like isoform X2 [Ptychodera flava]|uniref:sorting nexin-16-like isoform X2 n=1 Tax=Ptychodera flava TaxID=63121 RepID=UPI00396A968E